MPISSIKSITTRLSKAHRIYDRGYQLSAFVAAGIMVASNPACCCFRSGQHRRCPPKWTNHLMHNWLRELAGH